MALPVLVFLATLALTVGAAAVTRDSLEQASRAQLELLAGPLGDRVLTRLQTAANVARGTAGLFAAETTVKPDSFHAYVAAQGQPRWFSDGVVGWARSTESTGADAVLAEGRRNYARYAFAHAGPRYPVVLVSPRSEQHRELLGVDLADVRDRLHAIEKARDDGDVALVTPQRPGSSESVELYFPAYNGPPPETVEARRRAFRGVVFVHARSAELLGTAPRAMSPFFEFRITDAAQQSKALGISPGFDSADNGLVTRTMAFGVHELRVELTPTAANSDPSERQAVVAILSVGTLLAFALAALIFQQQRARRDAELAALALEFSNAELEQFAQVASHDLKAPLRGIAQLASFLEEDLEGALSPEVRKNFALLQGRVRRLQALIDGILNYARAGQSASNFETFDARAVAAETVALVAVPPEVQVTLPPPGLVINGDKTLLQQALMNLLSNALKHAPAGGHITVSAQADGAYVRFAVKDNGPGIAPEYHQRIWNMFATLSSRDEKESTGIGLAVVRKVVQAQGGRVWLESVPGHGATFSFTWPRRLASSRSRPLTTPVPANRRP